MIRDGVKSVNWIGVSRAYSVDESAAMAVQRSQLKVLISLSVKAD